MNGQIASESKEYSSKSEIINDLIRKNESAKEVEFIRMKLALAENRGLRMNRQLKFSPKANAE